MIVVTLLMGATGIYQGVRCIYISLDAEHTHHAYREVLEAMTVYVEEHGGRWPSGWDELADFSLRHDPSQFDRLSNLTEVRHRVEVQFNLTANEVSEMDADDVSAVRPIGPNYGENFGAIERLQQACRSR